MVRSGLDCFLREFPPALVDKRLGIVCHAASVTASLVPITEALSADSRATIGAVFGPQHGLFGQTQDDHAHPIFADGVGQVGRKPARIQIQRR